MDPQATLDLLGWAIDRRDWDSVLKVLAETVLVDYTEVFGGQAETIAGHDLTEQWRQRLGALDTTQHVITGVRAEPRDALSMRVTANVVAAHRRADQLWTIGGWYDTILTKNRIEALTLHPCWETGTRSVLE